MSRCVKNRVLRFCLYWASLAVIYGCMAAAPVAGYAYFRAEALDLDMIGEMPERTILYDCTGVEIGRVHGENRIVVGYDEVAPIFVEALLAREDDRFRDHGAVDYIGLARATVRNVKDGKFTQGASTITMQLARNSFDLGKGGTAAELHRKLLEVAVAHRIEREYKKDEILEHYMNRIFWGHRVRGVESASRFYFGKSAKQLDLSEAAMLAGIIRGPNLFSPFKNFEGAKRERDTTLDRMAETGRITPELAEETKAMPLVVRSLGERGDDRNYALRALEEDLELILREEKIERGGLTVITTIDKRLQEAAEGSLEKRLAAVEKRSGYRHQTRAEFQKLLARGGFEKLPDPRYIQGAVVLMENRSGAVRALVGGRDFRESRFDRARKAKRQVGSVFKPFVYATAFNQGLLPGSYVSDARLSRSDYPMMPRNWEPRNSDGKYGGYEPATYGLVRSRNTMAVRVGHFAGIEKMRELAGRAGFLGAIPGNMSAYLGSFEATPYEVATAYTLFPNGGFRPRPYLIEEIRDRDGKVLYRSGVLKLEVFSNGATYVTTKVLEQVTKPGGTAAGTRSLGFTKPCGGKTGTTDRYKDAWFAGFTSRLSCAVWVGMDDNKTTVSRGYGSSLALPVWVDVMKAAEKVGYPAETIAANRRLTPCKVCRFSAKHATEGCVRRGSAYDTRLPADLVPQGDCPQHGGRSLPRRAQPVR